MRSTVSFCGVHSLVSQTKSPTATGEVLVTAFHSAKYPGQWKPVCHWTKYPDSFPGHTECLGPADTCLLHQVLLPPPAFDWTPLILTALNQRLLHIDNGLWWVGMAKTAAETPAFKCSAAEQDNDRTWKLRARYKSWHSLVLWVWAMHLTYLRLYSPF